MEYIHPASIPSTKSELSLFSVPPTQGAIDSTYEVEYNPSASLESSQYHEINIPASDDFTDLSATMIHLKFKVIGPNGEITKKIIKLCLILVMLSLSRLILFSIMLTQSSLLICIIIKLFLKISYSNTLQNLT